MSKFNLALPENTELALKVKAQNQAGFWVQSMRLRKISSGEVRLKLEQIEDDSHRELVRKWLNIYMTGNRNA